MFYQEIFPVSYLRPYIQMYATLADDDVYEDYHSVKVPPAMCKNLVFYYMPERPVIANTDLVNEWLPPGLLLPQTTLSNYWKYKNRMDCFIVVFEPGKFRWLFPFPVIEFMAYMLTFEGANDKPMLDYYHRIILGKSTGDRVDISNKFLSERVALMEGKNDITLEAIKLIYADLQLNMASISSRLGVTGRHFRRVFSQEMEMQPKQYQKLVRISASINMLDKLKDGNTTEIAYECGFFDQSHFIETFKGVTGITPMQYLNKNVFMTGNN